MSDYLVVDASTVQYCTHMYGRTHMWFRGYYSTRVRRRRLSLPLMAFVASPRFPRSPGSRPVPREETKTRGSRGKNTCRFFVPCSHTNIHEVWIDTLGGQRKLPREARPFLTAHFAGVMLREDPGGQRVQDRSPARITTGKTPLGQRAYRSSGIACSCHCSSR